MISASLAKLECYRNWPSNHKARWNNETIFRHWTTGGTEVDNTVKWVLTLPQLASWRLFQCRESIAKITQLSHCVDETEEEFGDPETPRICGTVHQRRGIWREGERERERECENCKGTLITLSLWLSTDLHTGECYRAEVGVVHDKLLQKGFRLSVSGGSFPPCPPARFAMPAARGKTSLNARDWWKGKELFIQKLHKLRIMT